MGKNKDKFTAYDRHYNDKNNNNIPSWFAELKQNGLHGLLSIITKNRITSPPSPFSSSLPIVSTDIIGNEDLQNESLLKFQFNNFVDGGHCTTPLETTTDFISLPSSNESSTGVDEVSKVVVQTDSRKLKEDHPLHPLSSLLLPGGSRNYVDQKNKVQLRQVNSNSPQQLVFEVKKEKEDEYDAFPLPPRKRVEEETTNISKNLVFFEKKSSNPDVGQKILSSNDNNNYSQQHKNREAEEVVAVEAIAEAEVNSRHCHHYHHHHANHGELRKQHHSIIETNLLNKDSHQQEQRRRSQAQQQPQTQKPTTIYDKNNKNNDNNDNNNDLVDVVVGNVLVDNSAITKINHKPTKTEELQQNFIHLLNVEHLCNSFQPTKHQCPEARDLEDHHKNQSFSGCLTILLNNDNDTRRNSEYCCCVVKCYDIDQDHQHHPKRNDIKKFDGNQIQINDCFIIGDNYVQQQRQQGSNYNHQPLLSLKNKKEETSAATVGSNDFVTNTAATTTNALTKTTNLKHHHQHYQADYIIQFVLFKCGQCYSNKLFDSTQSSSTTSNLHQQQQRQQNHNQQQRSPENDAIVDHALESKFKNIFLIELKLINNQCFNRQNHHHNHLKSTNIQQQPQKISDTAIKDSINCCCNINVDDDGNHIDKHWIQFDLNKIFERFILENSTIIFNNNNNQCNNILNVDEHQSSFSCIDCQQKSLTNLIPPTAIAFDFQHSTRQPQSSSIVNLCDKHCVHLLTLLVTGIGYSVIGASNSDSVIQNFSVTSKSTKTTTVDKMVDEKSLIRVQQQRQPPPHRHYLRNGHALTNGVGSKRYMNGRQTMSTTALNSATTMTNGNHKVTNGHCGGSYIQKRPSSVSSSNSNESNKDLSSSTDCSLDTDSSGDYEYGPGIVDRLRHKFMALSSKTTSTINGQHYRFGQHSRKCVSSVDVSTLIKRCSSLEELTFKRQLKQCTNNNQQKQAPPDQQYRSTKPINQSSMYNGHQMVNGAKKKLMNQMANSNTVITNGCISKKLPSLPSLSTNDLPQYPRNIVQKFVQNQKLVQHQQQKLPKTTTNTNLVTSNNDLTTLNATSTTVATTVVDVSPGAISSSTITNNNSIDQHPHLHHQSSNGVLMNGGNVDAESCNGLNKNLNDSDSGYGGCSLKQQQSPLPLSSGSQNLLLLATPKPYMKRSKSVETLSLFSNTKLSTLNNNVTTTPTPLDDNKIVEIGVIQSEQDEINHQNQHLEEDSSFNNKCDTILPSSQIQLEINQSELDYRESIQLNSTTTCSPSTSTAQCESSSSSVLSTVDSEVILFNNNNNNNNNNNINNNNKDNNKAENCNECNNISNDNINRDIDNDKSTLSYIEDTNPNEVTATSTTSHQDKEQQEAVVVVAFIDKDTNDAVVDEDSNKNNNNVVLADDEDHNHHQTIIKNFQLEEEKEKLQTVIATTTTKTNNIELDETTKQKEEKEISETVQYGNEESSKASNNNNLEISDYNNSDSMIIATANHLVSSSSSSSPLTTNECVSKKKVTTSSRSDPPPTPSSASRTTKMIVTNELPKPDTVKTVKKLFEHTTTNANSDNVVFLSNKSSPDSANNNKNHEQSQPPKLKQSTKLLSASGCVNTYNTSASANRYRSSSSNTSKSSSNSSSSSSSSSMMKRPPPPIPPPVASRLRITKDATDSNANRTTSNNDRNLRLNGTSNSTKNYMAPKPPSTTSLSNGSLVNGGKKKQQQIDNNSDQKQPETSKNNNETSGFVQQSSPPSKIATNACHNDNTVAIDGVNDVTVTNGLNNDKSFPLNTSNVKLLSATINDNNNDDGDDNNNNSSNIILIKNNNNANNITNNNVDCSSTIVTDDQDLMMKKSVLSDLRSLNSSNSKTTPSSTTKESLPDTTTTPTAINNRNESCRQISSISDNKSLKKTLSSSLTSTKINENSIMKKEKEVIVENGSNDEELIKTLKPSILQQSQKSSTCSTKSTLWSASNLKSSKTSVSTSSTTPNEILKSSNNKRSSSSSSSSIVFDFRDNKNVKPNIAIQPTPYGAKPIPKRIMKEIVGRSNNSTGSSDSDDEDDFYCGSTEVLLPSGIHFQGENIVINSGSLLHKRNKNLSISFNDSRPLIFEYPSADTDEDSSDDDYESENSNNKNNNDEIKKKIELNNKPQTINSVSNLVNSITTGKSGSASSTSSSSVINGHVNVLNKKSFPTGSSNLASYKPSKVEESSFELGVTKTKMDSIKMTTNMMNNKNHQHRSSSTTTISNNQNEDEDCDTTMTTMIKPASMEDTVTFSQSSTDSDLLF